MYGEPMSNLHDEFDHLEATLTQLIGLLEEADERFWSPTLARGLPRVASHHLAGATYVLGCYGGVDTFSDFTLGNDLREIDPIRHRNLNARLSHLRTETFKAAQAIAARRSW